MMEKLILGLFMIAYALIGLTGIFLHTEIIKLKPSVHKTIQTSYLLNMTSDGLSIEIHPNEQTRNYHIKHKNITEQTMEEVWKIPGVVKDWGKYPVGTYFHSTKYALTVQKGKAFSWDEIEPSVLSVLYKIE